MKLLKLHYPGDPVLPIEQLNRQEFLQRCPRRPTELSYTDESGHLHIERHHHSEDYICCDLCNKDPGDVIYVLAFSRAYCQECFDEGLKKYTKER